MSSSGEGLPPQLVRDMFHSSRWTSHEGLGLSACRKIIKLMAGFGQSLMNIDFSAFKIFVDFLYQTIVNPSLLTEVLSFG